MKNKYTDLTGQLFGRLRVLARVENSKQGAARWRVLCACGVSKEVRSSSLTNGTTVSCGCLGRELASARKRTHGMTASFEYSAWRSMLKRCTNKKHPAYSRYGGSGISVCEAWGTFEQFFKDMGPCPYPRGSVDRVDNTRGYSPENCRWLPLGEQSKNRRCVLKINGLTVPEIAEANHIKTTTLRRRIKSGWPVDKLFKTPQELGTRR
jgi:hypothetical protein